MDLLYSTTGILSNKCVKIVEESNQFYFTNDFINIRVLKEDIENEKIEIPKIEIPKEEISTEKIKEEFYLFGYYMESLLSDINAQNKAQKRYKIFPKT